MSSILERGLLIDTTLPYKRAMLRTVASSCPDWPASLDRRNQLRDNCEHLETIVWVSDRSLWVLDRSRANSILAVFLCVKQMTNTWNIFYLCFRYNMMAWLYTWHFVRVWQVSRDTKAHWWMDKMFCSIDLGTHLSLHKCQSILLVVV